MPQSSRELLATSPTSVSNSSQTEMPRLVAATSREVNVKVEEEVVLATSVARGTVQTKGKLGNRESNRA